MRRDFTDSRTLSAELWSREGWSEVVKVRRLRRRKQARPPRPIECLVWIATPLFLSHHRKGVIRSRTTREREFLEGNRIRRECECVALSKLQSGSLCWPRQRQNSKTEVTDERAAAPAAANSLHPRASRTIGVQCSEADSHRARRSRSPIRRRDRVVVVP